MKMINADCEHIAVENPIGYINTHYRKADQIIQPYMFGDAFEKKTCLWLKNLPLLKPTNTVEPPKRLYYKSGKSMPAWYANAWKLPKDERSKLRSKTFPGIAAAMAEQWAIIYLKICEKDFYKKIINFAKNKKMPITSVKKYLEEQDGE